MHGVVVPARWGLGFAAGAGNPGVRGCVTMASRAVAMEDICITPILTRIPLQAGCATPSCPSDFAASVVGGL